MIIFDLLESVISKQHPDVSETYGVLTGGLIPLSHRCPNHNDVIRNNITETTPINPAQRQTHAGLTGVTVNGEQEGSEGGRGRPQKGRGRQHVWGGCPSWSLAHCFWGALRGVQHLEVGAAGVHLPTGHKVAREAPPHVPGSQSWAGQRPDPLGQRAGSYICTGDKGTWLQCWEVMIQRELPGPAAGAWRCLTGPTEALVAWS